jgi:GNAT superfamily N-acetyltransferase
MPSWKIDKDVKTRTDLVTAANLNYVGSYRKLAEHSADGEIRGIGGVFSFVTGVPIPLFNGCVVVGPDTAEDLEAAVEWVSGQGLPYRVWVDEEVAPRLSDHLLAHGLDRDPWSLPGMVLRPPPAPPPGPPGVTVEPVTESGLAAWLGVLTDGGLARDLADHLFPPSFASDPDLRLFTALLNGRPVGTSIAIRTGDVAGVYGVGTLPAARRRGVGTAAAWAAVDAGRAWDCGAVVLQASEMGFSTYVKMGFLTVVRYATFGQVSDTSR